MRHTIWHYLLMIVFSELVNFMWLGTGVIIAISGWVVFQFTIPSFSRIAVGLPILFIGLSLILMKIAEIISVIARPRRLKVLCRFCSAGEES